MVRFQMYRFTMDATLAPIHDLILTPIVVSLQNTTIHEYAVMKEIIKRIRFNQINLIKCNYYYILDCP